MNWQLILMAALVLVLGFIALRTFGGGKKMTPQEATALIEKGAKIVDVRSPGEYSGGHIEGAVNIPVDQIKKRAGELGPKSTPIVVYCASGMRSGSAMGTLKAQGFEEVYNIGNQSGWPLH